MALDTRFQEIRKLEESMKAANEDQAQRHEQVMKLLEIYGQQPITKLVQDTKIEELKELMNGLSYQ